MVCQTESRKLNLPRSEKEKSSYKDYSTKEVSVFWKSDLCIHSANCLIGLPNVFDNSKRPWINIEGASSKDIIKTVNTCPSRALIYMKNPRYKPVSVKKKVTKKAGNPARIQILKNGPILVTGNFIMRDPNKKKIKAKTETVALCRCGASKTKPFCDGNHLAEKFMDEM